MRSSRTARKIVGAVAAGAVSALLLGGVAAVTAEDNAGHSLSKDRAYSAGHSLGGKARPDGHSLNS